MGAPSQSVHTPRRDVSACWLLHRCCVFHQPSPALAVLHLAPGYASWLYAPLGAGIRLERPPRRTTLFPPRAGPSARIGAVNAGDAFVSLGTSGVLWATTAGFAPNPAGLYDMIGNVWELTTDLYQPNHLTPEGGPGQAPAFRPGQGRQRVIKGGSFLCAPNYCMRYRAGSRQPQDEDLGVSHLGFRTVLVAPGP